MDKVNAILERISARMEASEPPSRQQLIEEFCRRTDWRNRKGELCLSSANVCLKRLEEQNLVRFRPPAVQAPRVRAKRQTA